MRSFCPRPYNKTDKRTKVGFRHFFLTVFVRRKEKSWLKKQQKNNFFFLPGPQVLSEGPVKTCSLFGFRGKVPIVNISYVRLVKLDPVPLLYWLGAGDFRLGSNS